MDVIGSILRNNYKSIPVKSGKGFFILTKLRILGLVKNEPELKNKRAKDIMQFPYCISTDDSIETAMSVLRDLDVSRLPVVNKSGGTEGLIETVGLLRADTERKRSKVGEKSGEKIRMRGASVSSLMKKNIPKASPHMQITELINTMLEKNISTIIIEDQGKISGIVTPKLILESITKEPFRKSIEGVYVRISGLQKEDTFIKSVVDEEIRNEIRKLGKIIPIDNMILHVKKHKKTGNRQKYSVKGRLITENGYFFAADYGWDVTKVTRGILQKFEKEIIKKKEKSEIYRRGY
jgi:CBS domain-containing protein